MKAWLCLSLLYLFISAEAQTVSLTQSEQAFQPSQCSGRFVAHELEHQSTVLGGQTVRMFEANGGGVALGDLDNDGLLDIVLANQAGENSILWNQGELSFKAQAMEIGDSRAVVILDLDADGWQDIILTRQTSAPNFWRNHGDGSFSLEVLAHVTKPLYAMNWADLDGDGDLDLVGASYDAALLNAFGNDFLSSDRAGVFIYWQEQGRFREERLANEAQALALAIADFNGDERPDILVGNDFALADGLWLHSGAGFEQARLFQETSHSTMSFALADINNDGKAELFASDMLPYPEEDLQPWSPFLSAMQENESMENETQIMENVLQFLNQKTYVNQAEEWQVKGTGWSWSAKFGDLDQDGFLDLYVVNGMIEANIFRHLAQHELLEENQAFRNTGSYFEPKPDWGLASTLSGRGMSMADLDNDGDLDIVVNNLRGPAMLFENQLCQGSSLIVELHWSESKNLGAIGAKLSLETSIGRLYREITALSGYLSGDSQRIHFGFPEGAELSNLTILWPDGFETRVEELRANTLLNLSR